MSLLNTVKNVLVYRDTPIQPDFEMGNFIKNIVPPPPQDTVSTTLQDNLNYLKAKFNTEENLDVVIRNFKISYGTNEIDAFLIFYDGLTDKNMINQFILKPLMLNSVNDSKSGKANLQEVIYSSLITQTPLTETGDMNKIVGELTFGACALFAQGSSVAYIADVKGWMQRGVEKPTTESVLTGPQEAFNESLMANLSLVRKILKNPDLIAESVPIGKISQTPCVITYIKGVTNQSLIDEVRRRLENIMVDYIFSSNELEQYLEESTFQFMPQILTTERPERAASMLADGKVVIILNGSPFALVLPATAADFTEASEDHYVRFPYANLVRILRIIGLFSSVLLSGLFVAITTYHYEIIPTDLLFAIVATREKVPFPMVAEVMLMEIAFEMIREAGIRMPSHVASTLGIIGALILGQAAVSASIVSPILIIVVSISGIGSFATPTISLSRALTLSRLVYIALGALSGFLGIAMGLMVQGFLIAASSSFGVPFLAPVAPHGKASAISSFFVSPIWKKEHRPQELKPQTSEKQEHISRKWQNR